MLKERLWRKAMEKGIEKGMKLEHAKLLKTARALLSSGMSKLQVKDITELSDEEISELVKS